MKAEVHNIGLEAIGFTGARLGSRRGSFLDGPNVAMEAVGDSWEVAMHIRGHAFDQGHGQLMSTMRTIFIYGRTSGHK